MNHPTDRAGNGGNVTFQPGRKGGTNHPLAPGRGAAGGKDGAVIFRNANGDEALRIDGNGDIIVRGNTVATDREVYEVFREWLGRATVEEVPGGGAEGFSVNISARPR